MTHRSHCPAAALHPTVWLFTLLLLGSAPVDAQETPRNFTIAFIADQGLGSFNLAFVEDTGEAGLTISILGEDAVDTDAAATKVAAKAAFVATFATTGFGGSVVDRALADLTGRVNAVRSALVAPLAGVLGAFFLYLSSRSLAADLRRVRE